jgi:protein-arginine kinase
MSDKQKAIDKGLDGLDSQIVDIVGKFVKRRKEHYEQLAKKLQAELKKDTKRYAGLLADGKILQDDFEMLVKGRWAQLKIELLSETTISKKKFEDIAGAVLKVTVV